MGYQIRYGPPTAFEKKRRRRIPPFVTIIVAAVLLLCVAARIWPQTAMEVTEALFPGSNAGFSAFSRSLQQGEGVGDAVMAFCMEILNEAQ